MQILPCARAASTGRPFGRLRRPPPRQTCLGVGLQAMKRYLRKTPILTATICTVPLSIYVHISKCPFIDHNWSTQKIYIYAFCKCTIQTSTSITTSYGYFLTQTNILLLAGISYLSFSSRPFFAARTFKSATSRTPYPGLRSLEDGIQQFRTEPIQRILCLWFVTRHNPCSQVKRYRT